MKESKGEGEGGSPVLAYAVDWYIRILNRGYGSCAGPVNADPSGYSHGICNAGRFSEDELLVPLI